MGYYTRYEITTQPPTEAVEDAVKEVSGYSNPFDDGCKWYDHEDNCKAVSKMYPDVLIELSGEGEDSGDIWRKYFMNGKMQVCKAEIVFPQFDEAKLI